MGNINQQSLNPWFSMWTKPRLTIQQIIDTDPKYLVLLLAALSGISQALNQASGYSIGDTFDLPMSIVLIIILGSIAGIISLYIGGLLLRWTGRWIGGQGSSANIRAAIAWANVPVIWSLLLWIPGFALFGKSVFTTVPPTLSANNTLLYVLLGFSIINLVTGIWSTIIFLKSLGQVQGFSAWKALGNTCLTLLVILVPLFIIGLGLSVLVAP